MRQKMLQNILDGIRGPILVEKASGEHIQADDIAHGYKVGGV